MNPPPQAEPSVAVGAVVLDCEGRVLLVRRGRPPNRGSWTLPGGRVEPAEDLAEAVVRELREETGLRVRVVAPLGAVHLVAEGFSYVIHEHLAFVEGAHEPSPADDADDARWVNRTELATFAVSDAAAAVIDQAISLSACAPRSRD